MPADSNPRANAREEDLDGRDEAPETPEGAPRGPWQELAEARKEAEKLERAEANAITEQVGRKSYGIMS